MEAWSCTIGAVLLIGLAAQPLYAADVPSLPPWAWAAAYAAIVAIPLGVSWWKALADKKLPTSRNDPPPNHISGWSVISLAFAVSIIVVLATWAATSDATKETINAEWGIGVTFGLAAAFIFAALAPSWDLEVRARGLLTLLGVIVKPFGLLLSFIDSILVYPVACSAGAALRPWYLRYFVLFGVLAPSAYIGFWLTPPWGAIPIAWAFIVAISMSRRWTWVEDDRELAMLNRRFVGAHLRIGFQQDLRDEALLSFMSMFFLVPLALRQAQLAALDYQFELFELDRAGALNIMTWIAFFGSELAKAAPFVDWAEVYHVGGSDDSIVKSAIAQHFVFATRVLVDLVFLAALLQALAISARNAKQRALFYDGTLNRLDPFIEPKEFRKLTCYKNGELVENKPEVDKFPPYDPVRLVELSGRGQREAMRVAAQALRAKQGGADSVALHMKLEERAAQQDAAAIDEVINAIRAAGPERIPYRLNEARKKLNGVRGFADARNKIATLMAEATDNADKTQHLLDFIMTDSLGSARANAIKGLLQAARNNEPGVLSILRERADDRSATNREREAAREVLRRYAS